MNVTKFFLQKKYNIWYVSFTKIQQVSFPTEYVSKTLDYWEGVIFYDETKIGENIDSSGKQKYNSYCKLWKDFRHGVGLNFEKGVGDLVFIQNKMNAQQYLQILQNSLPSSATKFWQ